MDRTNKKFFHHLLRSAELLFYCNKDNSPVLDEILYYVMERNIVVGVKFHDFNPIEYIVQTHTKNSLSEEKTYSSAGKTMLAILGAPITPISHIVNRIYSLMQDRGYRTEKNSWYYPYDLSGTQFFSLNKRFQKLSVTERNGNVFVTEKETIGDIVILKKFILVCSLFAHT